MTALITGASGFVGGAVAERLRAGGERVIGLSRRPAPHADHVQMDLGAPDAIRRLTELRPAPEVIVHAAARAEPWGSAAQFHAGTVTTTAAIVRWAAALRPRPRLVHVSTASVLYSGRDRLDVRPDEETGLRFVGPYARTKAAAERMVRSYPGDWVILRPRAVFGPGDTALLPRLLDAADRARLPRFRRGPLSDLVFIDDLVDAVVEAGSAPWMVRRTLGVAGPESVDLQEVVGRVLAATGRAPAARVVPRGLAIAAAGAVERMWSATRPGREPPITRYALVAYACSFTFERPAASTAEPALLTGRTPLDEAIGRTLATLAADTLRNP
ncbi:NAD-dependent epimerase/dehydratase family protein [Cnuibacter sp. UC19_7]|uniref:NAD-dependent epimerase/dehydratase family protein n=1 Tax=Cnuibacter sp. UC19_7 TaxID=3350166 RepID=UPI003671973F